MSNQVTITGIADINNVLAQIAPREAKNLMRAVVADIAKKLAKDGAAHVPVEEGILKAEVFHKRDRGDKETVAASVRVGKKAFYWRFLEYGQGPDGVEHAMFLKALQALRPNMDQVYLETFVRKLEARLARERKRGG